MDAGYPRDRALIGIDIERVGEAVGTGGEFRVGGGRGLWASLG